MSRISIVCLASLGMAACLASSPRSGARDDVPEEIAGRQNPVTLSASKHKYYAKQYRAKCARCHGEAGKGGGAESADQAVPPTAFTDAGYMATRTDGQLFYQILMGGGTRCAMPAFGPESDHGWSEEKIWSMVAFIRHFAKPAVESPAETRPPASDAP